MGSNPGEGVSIHEMPRHEVTIPVYRLGKFPVTNAQYEQYVRLQEKPVAPVLGWNGRRVPDGQEDNPVMGVTLDDAKGYCKWLSEITKRKYELPNEAQLEKAYKGLYGCSDIIDNIYLWTCALWGEKGSVLTRVGEHQELPTFTDFPGHVQVFRGGEILIERGSDDRHRGVLARHKSVDDLARGRG